MTSPDSRQVPSGAIASLVERRADRTRAVPSPRTPQAPPAESSEEHPATVFGVERLRDAGVIAELLGIPAKTVLQYARDGRLPCVRIGKHVRFRVSDVEAALRSGDDD